MNTPLDLLPNIRVKELKQEQKVNELPKNNRVKTKSFELETYNVIQELVKHNIPNWQQFHESTEKSYPEITNNSSTTNSLWNILGNSKILHQFLEKYKKSIDKKDIDSYAALILRTQRFRLKFYVIKRLNRLTPIPYFAITQKIEEIEKDLQKHIIRLDLDAVPDNGPKITFSSTISLIAKLLTNLEAQYKSLLPGIVTAFQIDLSFPAIHSTGITNALNSIAPIGFIGIQSDYYYIVRLLLSPQPLSMFNSLQQHQWDSYLKEFDLIFRLFYTNPNRPINLSLLMEKKITINVPFTKFMASTSTSSNSFSRIINAINVMVPVLWVSLLVHINSLENPKV